MSVKHLVRNVWFRFKAQSLARKGGVTFSPQFGQAMNVVFDQAPASFKDDGGLGQSVADDVAFATHDDDEFSGVMDEFSPRAVAPATSSFNAYRASYMGRL